MSEFVEDEKVEQEISEIQETVEPEELFENLISENQEAVQISEKVKQPAKGSRKALMNQIKELCKKLEKDPAEFKLSRQKKDDLKIILSDLMQAGIEKVMDQEILDVGIEVPEINQKNKKTQFVVAALTRMNLAVMRGVEMLSQNLELGYEVHGWAESFEKNRHLKEELQACLAEVYEENEWLDEYLSCWYRLGILFISTLLMSVRKQEPKYVFESHNPVHS